MIIKKEETRVTDENGNEKVSVKETTIQKDPEPNYIKIYTDTWCEFNQIPLAYRELFLQLAMRMSYCNSQNLDDSQIVYTGEPISSVIMKELGWKKAMYQKALRNLCDCGAIRKIKRSVYQINPSYAGKGNWKFNPQLKRGGVKELVATFKINSNGEREVDTQIIWADDGRDTEQNGLFRAGMGVRAVDNTILKMSHITRKKALENNTFTDDEEELFAKWKKDV